MSAVEHVKIALTAELFKWYLSASLLHALCWQAASTMTPSGSCLQAFMLRCVPSDPDSRLIDPVPGTVDRTDVVFDVTQLPELPAQ